jgi:PmbA protein
MIERALERAMQKAQGAEISVSQRRSSGAEYEDDKLKRVDAAQTSHVGVRVIVNGKVGLAGGTDPSDIDSVVNRAIEVAEFGSEARFEFPGPAEAPEVKVYDAQIPTISREEMVAVGGEMLELVKAHNSEAKVSAGAGWSTGTRRFVNSRGLDISTEGSSYSAGVSAVLVRGTDILWVGRDRSWRRKDVDPKALAARTIEYLRYAEKTATVASKTMPVLFTPRGLRVLTLPVLMGVNGKNVLKGDSPRASKLGTRICGPEFSLIDDGTIDFAPSSGRYDGEGVPRRRNEIVREGLLQCFLYDLETAGKAGTESTGSGVGCGPANVLIGTGASSFEEMVKGLTEGVIVEHVLGLGQGNVINGDFSVNISLGYKVEHGEIVGRVKNTMIAGNAYDALSHIAAVGAEGEWNGSTCAPPVLIEGLSVVSKE